MKAEQKAEIVQKCNQVIARLNAVKDYVLASKVVRAQEDPEAIKDALKEAKKILEELYDNPNG
jgi:phosphohistidine phosphatase SixA